MNIQCPKCSRVLYSRRHKLCGFCGAAVPAELLLTPVDLAAMEEADARLKNELATLKKGRDQAEREANAAMANAAMAAVVSSGGA